MRHTLGWTGERLRGTIYLSILLFVKAATQIALYQRGFTSVAADEFERGIAAAQWALQPRLDLFQEAQAWLPFEKYLNGLALMLWPDVIWMPRLTVFLFSCLLLVMFYLLVDHLFESFPVAALASLLVICQPWYVWLSGTPMLEIYYFACFFAGLLFLVLWLKEGRKRCWLWAGICFMVASGFHVQSWPLIEMVNLLTLPVLYGLIQRRDRGSLRRLLAYYLLSNTLIISLTAVEAVNTGHILSFFSLHTDYSRWFYGGYNVSVLAKVLYYPRLVHQYTSLAVWVLLFLSLFFLLPDRNRCRKLVPLALAGLSLGFSSVVNVFSVPATAAPGRYSLFYVLMLSPYVAYGTYKLFRVGTSGVAGKYGGLLSALAVATFLYGTVWSAIRIPRYPEGLARDAVSVGRKIAALLPQAATDHSQRYMVELSYWDFLAVELTAGHYKDVIYDRKYDERDREAPSVFLEGSEAVYSSLTSQGVRYVVLRDPSLKKYALDMRFLVPLEEVGDWTIYEVTAR